MGSFGNQHRWRLCNFLRAIAGFCLVLTLLLGGGEARAGVLSDRLSNFPHWDSKPPVPSAQGDLVYPDWMAGNWTVSNVLVDLIAPLAPDLVTPGFESNRQYLHQEIKFNVRFQPASYQLQTASFLAHFQVQNQTQVIADRAFNGLNIGRAYLGENGVLSVKVDPANPNRQITVLPGERQLIYIVTNRGSETPKPDEFIATEISQQIFKGESQIYLNEVETTTAYRFLEAEKKIEADQVTAIYLSPQDPDYFAAFGRPVALYRYRLELVAIQD